MYTCPHCFAASISAWRKANSSPFFPVRCRVCGGECVASGWSQTVLAVGGELLVWGSIIFAIGVGSFYGLLVLPVGMAALAVGVNRIFPLVAIDAGMTAARRRAIKHFWIAVVLALAFLAARGAWKWVISV
jgi:hypothetical protein